MLLSISLLSPAPSEQVLLANPLSLQHKSMYQHYILCKVIPEFSAKHALIILQTAPMLIAHAEDAHSVLSKRASLPGTHLCWCMALQSRALWEAGSTVLLVPHRSDGQLSNHAGQCLHIDRLRSATNDILAWLTSLRHAWVTPSFQEHFECCTCLA